MRLQRCLPALALLLALPAGAAETASSAPPKDPAAKEDAPTAKSATAVGPSLTAARDPVTGALRPLTPEEARRLLARLPLAAPEPLVVTLPDGTKTMRLGPEHAVLSVVRRNPDGTVTSACVQGTDEARAFLEAKPGPVPATREK